MKRKRKLHFRNYATPLEKDNEEFIVARCAQFTLRVLEKFPDLIAGCLEYLFALKDGEAENALAFVETQLHASKLKSSLVELDELRDLDDWATSVRLLLGKGGQRLHDQFQRFIYGRLRRMATQKVSESKSSLARNLLALQKMLSLGDKEADLLLIFYLMKDSTVANQLFDSTFNFDISQGRRYLAAALDVDREGLARLLRGNLVRSGALEVTGHYNIDLGDGYLTVLENPSPESLQGQLFQKVEGETIPISYHLISEEIIEHICRLLTRPGPSSTHILLYGAPGTGKTSFARGMAAKLGLDAYQIVSSEANSGVDRRTAIRVCKYLTNKGSRSLIFIDEADNLLNTEFSWMRFGETMDKGWLNQLLDEPGATMLWIANRIGEIEDSVLRRFAFSLTFLPMGQRQRLQQWRQVRSKNQAESLVTDLQLEALARQYEISAAVMEMAMSKAKAAGYRSSRHFVRAVRLGLEAYMALANGGIAPRNRNRIEAAYSLEGLNLSCDLKGLMGRLEAFDDFLRHGDREENASMNLLLYGPPGTGKSEFARYLARHLDRELMVRRASDLLNMYVGQSEKAVARAFAEAERGDAVLVIDEADSFLFSRNMASKTWETSLVNEFLTQMEQFRGILICTTNRMEGLDEAAIRRFAGKVGFDLLTGPGNLVLYRRLLAPLVKDSLEKRIVFFLESLSGLAPGDFKTVRDNHRWVGKVTHEALVQALKEEAKIKAVHRGEKSLGF